MKQSWGGGGVFEHYVWTTWLCRGRKCAPSHVELEDCCTKPVKAPFLAQIDFSWSRYVLRNAIMV